MHMSHPFSAAVMLAVAGLTIQAARADTTLPPNLSCISERPIPHQRVLRDCDRTPEPEPVVIPEPYLTPSQIPLYQKHDASDKGGRTAGAGDRPAGRDRPAGAN